jgi:hypothetical protein
MTITEPMVPVCRYCLENDSISDFRSPCRCSGSSKYVHKKCLVKWIETKQEGIVLPGFFRQFDIACEVCKTKYNFFYTERNMGNNCKDKLLFKLMIYFLVLTSSLLVCYYALGSLWYYSYPFLTFQSKLLTGFLCTHFILGVSYGVVWLRNNCDMKLLDLGLTSLLFLNNDYNRRNTGSKSKNDTLGAILILLFVAVLIYGVVLTVAFIYYDVMSRVVQKHRNLSIQILDIKDYSEGDL